MSTLTGAALLVAAVCDSVRRLAARGPLGVFLSRLGGRRTAVGAAECRLVQLLLGGWISPAAYRGAMAELADGRRPDSHVRQLLGPRGPAR
ncbi:hypothetical protein [Streptomyces canus]|uniref:hypothetical protein n=1 Tax=Streptomyces canus TaxID=58343 RepID=UPI003822F964